MPSKRSKRWARVGGALIAIGAVAILVAPGCSLLVPAIDECSANAECAGKGQHPICRQLSPRRCVDLTSSDCPDLVGPWQDDNAVIFGLIAPRDSTGESILNGAHLAVDQINTIKLPPAPGSTALRPVAVVGCNDQADSATSVRSAQHLVDAGVQAIDGAAFSGITINVAQQATIPAGVLLMSPSATSDALSDLADEDPTCVAQCGTNATCKAGCPELLWRTSPPDSIQGAAIIRYFKSGFEQEIKTHAMKTTGNIKVAIAYKGDAYGKGLKGVVESGLIFNGQSALTQLNGNYVPLDYGDPDDPTSDPLKYDTTVQRLEMEQPDVILMFGTGEAIAPNAKDPGSGIMDRVEKGWSGTIKPFWFFSDGGVSPELVTTARSDGATNRTRATAPGTNNPNFSRFESAYLGQFPSDPLGSPQVFGAAGSYDIMYLFSYATVAARGNTLTGANLVRGLTSVVGGTVIPAGTDKVSDAFNNLSSGAAIQYDGASGPLHFDLTKGEAASDIIVWCVPQASTNTDPIPSQLLYSASADMMIGTYQTGAMGCSP